MGALKERGTANGDTNIDGEAQGGGRNECMRARVAVLGRGFWTYNGTYRVKVRQLGHRRNV